MARPNSTGTFAERAERKRQEGGLRRLGLGALFIAFLLVPLVLLKSIISLEPAQGILVLVLICGIVSLFLPLHRRATNSRPILLGLIAYVAIVTLWPRYLAIDLPFLPYLTPTRALLLVLLAVWLFVASTSATVHDRLWRRLKAMPMFSAGLASFLILTVFSVAFSSDISWSARAFLNQLTEVFLPFLVAISLIATQRDLRLLVRTFVVVGIILGLLVIPEVIMQQNFFTTHLKGLVAYDAEWLDQLFEADFRNGMIRAKATFISPLSLAEFMLFTLPFTVYWAESTKKLFVRIGLIGFMVLALWAIWSTNSRTSILMSVVLLGVYALLRGCMFLRLQSKSKLRPLVILGISAIVLSVPLVVAVVFFQLDWQTAFGATGTRTTQVLLSLPKIASHPMFGYGPGLAASVIDYRANGESLTIDSQYLMTALDSGIPALLCFLFVAGAMVWKALRMAFSDTPERTLALAMAASAIGFLMDRATLSQPDNLGVFFIMLGGFVALNALANGSEEPAEEEEAALAAAKQQRRRRRVIVGSPRWQRQLRAH